MTFPESFCSICLTTKHCAFSLGRWLANLVWETKQFSIINPHCCFRSGECAAIKAALVDLIINLLKAVDSCHHIETSQLICSVNQLVSF